MNIPVTRDPAAPEWEATEVPIRFRIAKQVHALTIYKKRLRDTGDPQEAERLRTLLNTTQARLSSLSDQARTEAAAIRSQREVTVTGPVKATDRNTGETLDRYTVAVTNKQTGRTIGTAYRASGEQAAFSLALRMSRDRGLDIADRTATRSRPAASF